MVSNNVEYQGVPTGADLENNSNQKKYTVNKSPPAGHIIVSKTACILMTIGVFVLLLLAIVATIFIIPLVKGNDEQESPAQLQKAEIFPSQSGSIIKKTEDPPEVLHKRLPPGVQPTHYRVKIMPYLTDGNFTTSGTVTIKLYIVDDTRTLILHAKDLDIHKDKVTIKNLKDNTNIPLLDQKYDASAEKYIITTSEDLSRDENYELSIKYTGYLKSNMQGFYRSSYIHSKTNETRWLASTQFSPTSARRAFPCMDEPSLKAKFTISLARPNNMTTLSNMPIKESTQVGERANWVWDHYMETPTMPTYLVAFIVSDLQKYVTLSEKDITLSVWSRQEAISQTNYAGNIGPKLLKFFENKFNIKFPLPKMDMVAVPDFGFNAMENWGLITFRESALLFDPKESTIDDKRNIATVMAHEIAHQWFGNLVTPKWWDDLWLKEGFATYYEYVGADNVEPSWKIMEEFSLEVLSKALSADSLPSSRPLHFNIINSDQIIQAFDSISYSKGASIIRMAHHALGESTFTKGLLRYLNAHNYSNADHDDLWNALNAQIEEEGAPEGNITVSTSMNPWITQAGYPVLSASYDSGNNVLTVKQKRYFLDPENVSNNTWYIPISCTTSNERNFNNTKPQWWMLPMQETTFPLSTKDWYLLNLQQTGYYIVNYDDNNWKQLIRDFTSFPPIIRGQLVSDSMSLARSGIIDYEIPFSFIDNVGRFDPTIQYIPLKASLDSLLYVRRMLLNTPIYGGFEKFVMHTFSYPFEAIKLEEKPSETYLQQKIRRTVLSWTLTLDDYDVLHTARELYREWILHGTPIKPNFRAEASCAAIRVGDESDWKFALAVYLKAKTASEKIALLKALACSRRQWLLSRLLDMMIQNNSGVRKQDGALLFSEIAKNPVGNQLAFDFLRNHWSDILAHYGDGFNMVSKLIESLTPYMNTEFQVEQLELFREQHKHELGAAKQAFDRSIQTVIFNVKWMKMNYKSIQDWLENHKRYHRY